MINMNKKQVYCFMSLAVICVIGSMATCLANWNGDVSVAQGYQTANFYVVLFGPIVLAILAVICAFLAYLGSHKPKEHDDDKKEIDT